MAGPTFERPVYVGCVIIYREIVGGRTSLRASHGWRVKVGLSLERAVELAGMYARSPPSIAMQALRCVANGWACARRMRRLPRACVFGCVGGDALRQDAERRIRQCAALRAGGECAHLFGFL